MAANVWPSFLAPQSTRSLMLFFFVFSFFVSVGRFTVKRKNDQEEQPWMILRQGERYENGGH